MENEIMTLNYTKGMFTDPTLNKATDRIIKLGTTVRKCAYETAAIMAKVDETKCYENDGFKSVHDWAMKVFGFKKSVSYSLLRIGKDFTDTLYNENGKVTGYMSKLSLNEDNDFTVSQVEKMLPAGFDTAATLVNDGAIKTDMTCKEIEKVIKATINPETETSADDGNTESEPTEPETDAEIAVIRVFDESGNAYDVPANILAQYAV